MTPGWLSAAEVELGTTEIAGPVDHNPRILQYFKATTYHAMADEVPWCAAFVCWCLEAAGVASTKSARARDFLRWGVAIGDPAPEGAIVVLRRGSGKGSAGPEVIEAPGHVGFALWSDDDHVRLLGGNQGNRVSVQAYPRDRVLGFRWTAPEG
jgi:uncharacterized protein (TIGR02594 family)